jgi:hypothetical protein
VLSKKIANLFVGDEERHSPFVSPHVVQDMRNLIFGDVPR